MARGSQPEKPDPPGGRAAERLRDFLSRRSGGAEPQPAPGEDEDEGEGQQATGESAEKDADR
jgi:hypothetical protein